MTEEKALDIVEKVISKMYEKVRLLEAKNKELEIANKGLKEQLRIGGVGNWVTFKETKPTESERYLIKENEAVYIAEYSKEEDFWYDEDFNKIYNVDYWMKLPE